MSCSCRTWRSCQTIIVSSTVPIPPGHDDEGVGDEHEVVQPGEERLVLEDLADERVDVLLERQVDPDADRAPVAVRPGQPGPLVRRLHQAGAAAGDDVAAQAGQLRGQVADGRVDPVVGVGPGRAEDGDAVALAAASAGAASG